MSWAKLDDRFFLNLKVTRVPLEAVGVYCLGLTYASHNETDGFLPDHALHLIRATKEIADQLVDVNLWCPSYGDDPHDRPVEEGGRRIPGYDINDFLAYNPSHDELEERRQEISRKRSEAGKRGAFARWGATDKTMANPPTQSDGMASEWQSPSQRDSPVPVPPIERGTDVVGTQRFSFLPAVVERLREGIDAGAKIVLDERLLERALTQAGAGIPDLEAEVLHCADWIVDKAPRNGRGKPKHAHLTVRTWLSKRRKELQQQSHGTDSASLLADMDEANA